MKKTIIMTALGLVSATSAQAALTAFSDATTIPTGSYTNPGPGTTDVRGGGGGQARYQGGFAFDIDALLTSEGITLADLATRTFTFSVATTVGPDMGAGDYSVGVSNFGTYTLPDTGTNGTSGNWNAVNATATSNGYVSTGVSDNASSQTVSRSGISLSGALAGEQLAIFVAYDNGTAAQSLVDATLTVDPVPEPSSTALLGLGGLALLLRRRK